MVAIRLPKQILAIACALTWHELALSEPVLSPETQSLLEGNWVEVGEYDLAKAKEALGRCDNPLLDSFKPDVFTDARQTNIYSYQDVPNAVQVELEDLESMRGDLSVRFNDENDYYVVRRGVGSIPTIARDMVLSVDKSNDLHRGLLVGITYELNPKKEPKAVNFGSFSKFGFYLSYMGQEETWYMFATYPLDSQQVPLSSTKIYVRCDFP